MLKRPYLFLALALLCAAPALSQTHTFTPTPTSTPCFVGSFTCTPSPTPTVTRTVTAVPGCCAIFDDWPVGGPSDTEMVLQGNLVYVVETGSNRIQRKDLQGNSVAAPLTGGGSLLGPFDVALDQAGFVYCTSRNNGLVYKINPANDSLAATPMPVTLCAGLAVDGTGAVYAASSLADGNDKVYKFRETSPGSGTYAAAATIGNFNAPNDLYASSDGVTLVVLDTANFIIKRYLETPPGSDNYLFDQVVVDFATNGEMGKVAWPYQLARDGAGNFYVTDIANRFQVFDPNWSFLYGCYTPSGNSVGIEVDDTGAVYVGVSGQGRIYKYQPCQLLATVTPTPTGTSVPVMAGCDQLEADSYAYPSPAKAGGTLKFHYVLCEASGVVFSVYNTAADRVARFESSGGPGPNTYSAGASGFAPGLYYYILEVKGPKGTTRMKPRKFAVTK